METVTSIETNLGPLNGLDILFPNVPPGFVNNKQ